MSGLDDFFKSMNEESKQEIPGPTRAKLGKRAEILRRIYEDHHSSSHTAGWLLYIFSILALIVGVGMVGGMWSATPTSTRTSSFENYSYAAWASLGIGIILSTIFVAYFYHSMDGLRQKGLKSINAVFGEV